jgi:hypothetical protein
MRVRLRRLHVEGREYTWRAEIRRVYSPREVRVRVWGAGKNSQALQADLIPPDEWGYPEPADVCALIQDGLARGWQPDAKGGTCTMPPRILP